MLESDVVDQDEDTANAALLNQLQLLLLQPGHQIRIPLVELKLVVALCLQEAVQLRVTVLRPHERDDQIIVGRQLPAQMVVEIALPLASVSDH